MQIHLKLFLYILQWHEFTYWLNTVIILIAKEFISFSSLQRTYYPRNYVSLHVRPPTHLRTRFIYVVWVKLGWKTALTWFTVYAADAISVVHAMLVEMLVNTEPWKLLGFSYPFHSWRVWDIISIPRGQMAFWGRGLGLQGDVFRRLRCGLKRHRTLLQVMHKHIPFYCRSSFIEMLRNNYQPNFALWQNLLWWELWMPLEERVCTRSHRAGKPTNTGSVFLNQSPINLLRLLLPL